MSILFLKSRAIGRLCLIGISAICISTSNSLSANDFPMTLAEAIKTAQDNDPWLKGSKHSQSALESQSVEAGTLPDPKLSLSLANLPVDGFDFNQEPMTQVKIGYSQMFPRGDTLKIEKRRLYQLSEQFPYLRVNRKAKLAETVTHLWLDAFEAKESILLIESNRSLFEQLSDVAQASYASTIGKTRQQDLVRAQLELTRLDDRLTQLELNFQIAKSQLVEWLYSNDIDSTEKKIVFGKLPDIPLNPLFGDNSLASDTDLVKQLMLNPAVLAIDKKIEASKTAESLAEQSYKTAWGVNASYGYRDDAPTGDSRVDFFSIGLNFEIPFNTSNRQDKKVAVASSHTAKTKTEKWQLLRRLMANFKSLRAKHLRLAERQVLYQEKLLPQMHQQAEASLTAYTNDDGDFSEVVRARIAQLNAQIDSLGIDVERQKSIASLNYYLTQATQEFGESK